MNINATKRSRHIKIKMAISNVLLSTAGRVQRRLPFPRLVLNISVGAVADARGVRGRVCPLPPLQEKQDASRIYTVCHISTNIKIATLNLSNIIRYSGCMVFKVFFLPYVVFV